ncbi:glycosyltransferase [Dysgonomonas sp. ZJ279]|uniref:glycosyltransferase n=1 Tax=Dysgonomonas sp. ZJ279 TaxID=2709796 RepID=UPI0013EB1766|nr:glycosyltransferase [Dysgonomonas sp. ZJ279]
MPHPLVSVVMPTYNCAGFVFETITSILTQTYPDFEFIIIDDGSTDNTLDIIRTFDDSRIQLLICQDNRGNYTCRNEGIRRAKGRYICVMDGDDIAIPHRIARQVSILENDESLLACGTYFEVIGGQIYIKPRSYPFIKLSLLINNMFLHPSLMIRKDTLISIGCYSETYYYSSDYDLVCKIALQGKIINIPEVLMKYRLHSKQISSAQSVKQAGYADQTRTQYVRNLGFRLSIDEEKIFTLMMASSILSLEDIQKIEHVSEKVKKQNEELSIYDGKQFE